MHSSPRRPAALTEVNGIRFNKDQANPGVPGHTPFAASSMGIFSNLRERRLFQIVFSYLAAGWIGLEVVDQLIQNEVLPALVYRIALVWYLAGIPAALLIGWHHGEKGKQHAPLSEKVTIVALAVIVLTFTGSIMTGYVQQARAIAAAEASALDLHRVAILYFDDYTPGGQFGHVADGLTEGLIEELSMVPALDVISRNGVRPFRGEGLDASEVGRTLEAGAVVKGSITQEGDQLRVDIALLEGETGAAFDRATFKRPAADPLAVQDELVSEVARLLRNQLGEEVQLKRSRRQAVNPGAWVLYQRAETARKSAEDALRHHEGDAAVAAFDRADSLLSQAELIDGQWTAPAIMRGEIRYRRARMEHDRHERVRWIEAGLAEANRVLERESTNAKGFALRGTLRYYKYLQGVIHDEDEARALRDRAREDLVQATRLDPSLATAYTALQHLYITSESLPDAVMAGQRAYEADAYLDAAEEILWRLYGGQYDLGNFDKALWACRQGAKRFPLNDRFATCELELMHTPALQPDPERAWQLVARVDSLAAPSRREYAGIQSRLYLAGALHRASRVDGSDVAPDSGRAVLERAHRAITPEIDPERDLFMQEAAMLSMMGDDDAAIDLLKIHRAADPSESYEHHWWWRTVRSHPRYQELAPAHH